MADLNISVDMAQLQALNKEMLRTTSTYNIATRNLEQFNGRMSASTRGMNRFGLVTQQAGYQIGDFLVQVQSGTNAFVAFGQQATQLVGLMTTFGGKFIAIGTALGILIPLTTAVAAWWMRTSEAQDAATESAERLAEAQKKLQDVMSTTQVELDKLRFGVDESYQVELLREQIRLRSEINIKVAEANNYLQTTTDSIDRQRIKVAEMQSEIDNLASAYNNAAKSMQEQERLSATLAINQNVLKAAAESNKRILESIAEAERQRLATADAIHNAMIASSMAQQKSSQFAKLLREEMEKAGISTVNLSNVDIASGIWGGAAAALALADRLGIALSNANALSGIANYEASGGPDEARRRNALTMGKEGGRLAGGAGGIRNFGSGRSGGGGGSDPFTQRFEDLQRFLQSESELEIETYNERQSTLQAALDRKLITIQEYNGMEMQLKQEHNKVMEELDAYRYGSGLAQAETFFGDMASAFASGNDKMRRAGEVFAGIEATINAYRAFNQVLADPSLPFFAKIPSAVSVLAAGLRTVQAIKGGGRGGASVGGSVRRGTSSVPAAAAPDPRPQTVYIDSLQPDGLYSGQTLINLFDALYDENDKRGKVFVVARG